MEIMFCDLIKRINKWFGKTAKKINTTRDGSWVSKAEFAKNLQLKLIEKC